jgi:hypothetical protein
LWGSWGRFFKKESPGRRRHGFTFFDRRKNIDYKYFLRLLVDRKEEKRYISSWRKKMNTVEIKTLLHEGIENIDDKDLLLSIKDLVDEKYVPMDIKKLSPWQIQRIDNAKKQIEQGNYLTDAEADKVVDEWLKK